MEKNKNPSKSRMLTNSNLSNCYATHQLDKLEFVEQIITAASVMEAAGFCHIRLFSILQDLAELHLLAGGAQQLEVAAALFPEGGDAFDAIGADGVALFLAVGIVGFDVLRHEGNMVDLALDGFADGFFVHFIDGVTVLDEVGGGVAGVEMADHLKAQNIAVPVLAGLQISNSQADMI